MLNEPEPGYVAGRDTLELMSAESALAAVAIVRALLHGDIEGPTVLLPDGVPDPRPRAGGQPDFLSARVTARAEGSTWTGSSGSGRTARGDAELVMAVRPWEASVTSAAAGPSASCGHLNQDYLVE